MKAVGAQSKTKAFVVTLDHDQTMSNPAKYQRGQPITHAPGSPGGSKSKSTGSVVGAKPYGPAGGMKEDVYEGTASDDQQQDFGGMGGSHKGVKITSPSGETEYFSDKKQDVRAVNTHAGIVMPAITKPPGSLVGGPAQQMVRMNSIPAPVIGGAASQMADPEDK